MPTQKDCKYSQLSQLSQIRGQDKLLFRNILKHGDEELPGLGDGSDVHALVRRVRIEDGRSYETISQFGYLAPIMAHSSPPWVAVILSSFPKWLLKVSSRTLIIGVPSFGAQPL